MQAHWLLQWPHAWGGPSANNQQIWYQQLSSKMCSPASTVCRNSSYTSPNMNEDTTSSSGSTKQSDLKAPSNSKGSKHASSGDRSNRSSSRIHFQEDPFLWALLQPEVCQLLHSKQYSRVSRALFQRYARALPEACVTSGPTTGGSHGEDLRKCPTPEPLVNTWVWGDRGFVRGGKGDTPQNIYLAVLRKLQWQCLMFWYEHRHYHGVQTDGTVFNVSWLHLC